MDPKIIGEVLKVFITMGDAQEFLGDQSFTHVDPGSSSGQALPARMARPSCDPA